MNHAFVTAPPVLLARRELQRRCELGRLRARLAELERAQRLVRAPAETLPTGFPALDEALGGGFQRGALNEILLAPGEAAGSTTSTGRSRSRANGGGGALEAFLPALARLRERWLAWIELARLPYPPALAQAGIDLGRLLLVQPANARDQAWAIDLALRSGACDGVIARLNGAEVWADDRSLRRLQLAAEESGALGLLVRPGGRTHAASPSTVRLLVAPVPSSDPRRRVLRVDVLRCRGGGVQTGGPLFLEWSRDPLDEPATAAAPACADLGASAEPPRSALAVSA